MFGNPEFLRYNATANLSFTRILLSLWHRMLHLTLYMNLYVPVVAALGLLLSPRVPGTRHLPAPAIRVLYVVLAGNALAFSVLGGALLTRYLLPLYPLVLLLAVSVWQERLRAWPAVAALSGAGFLAALLLNPPYSFAPEDNLTYRDFVLLHQQAIQLIDTRYPAATVLTRVARHRGARAPRTRLHQPPAPGRRHRQLLGRAAAKKPPPTQAPSTPP